MVKLVEVVPADIEVRCQKCRRGLGRYLAQEFDDFDHLPPMIALDRLAAPKGVPDDDLMSIYDSRITPPVRIRFLLHCGCGADIQRRLDRLGRLQVTYLKLPTVWI